MDPQSTTDSLEGSTTKEDNEKFCHECGEKIKKQAVVCPHCGVKQKGQVSKLALVLLTFFMGGLGMHKFYLGKNWIGVLYILLCWTGIPGLVSLVETVIYICTSSERLNEKYTASGSPVIIAVIAVIVGLFITGIIAAIAIPQFIQYRERAQALSHQPTTEQVLFIEQMERPIRG